MVFLITASQISLIREHNRGNSNNNNNNTKVIVAIKVEIAETEVANNMEPQFLPPF